MSKCKVLAKSFWLLLFIFFVIWSFTLLRDRRQILLLILTKSHFYQKTYGYLLISGETSELISLNSLNVRDEVSFLLNITSLYPLQTSPKTLNVSNLLMGIEI